MWLMCRVINLQGNNYLYGGGEPSHVAHMSHVQLMCGN